MAAESRRRRRSDLIGSRSHNSSEADPRPETGSLRFLLSGSQMGGRWDSKTRVRGPEMFSPPELDVANGCESKLSLHGKQTHRDRWSSSRVTDARVGWCVQSGTDPRTQRGGQTRRKAEADPFIAAAAPSAGAALKADPRVGRHSAKTKKVEITGVCTRNDNKPPREEPGRSRKDQGQIKPNAAARPGFNLVAAPNWTRRTCRPRIPAEAEIKGYACLPAAPR